MYIDTLIRTLEITSPVVLLVLLGVWLRRSGAIDASFISMASRLVFSVSLPVLMFMAIVNAENDGKGHSALIMFSLGAGAGAFAVAAVAARVFAIPVVSRGAFVQASFRSNLGIVGLALCLNAYPLEGAVLGAIVLAVVTPLYNLLSVWVLASTSGNVRWRDQLVEVLKNPLIIAIVAAAVVRWTGYQPGPVIQKTGTALGAMTLPLALIGIGGSLSASAVRASRRGTLLAVMLKLVILPVLIVAAAIGMGFRGAELMVLALMFSSPTAAAAFVMAVSMKADGQLTANVIALSTLGAAFSVSAMIYVLTLAGLV